MLMTTCSLGLGELRSSNSTPRKHSQRQIKKAKDLFAKQSIVVPIIVDEYHHIIDGHLRFMVARELGIENLNAVVVSEASTAEIIELELALNRLGEDSNWDEARLKEKLEQPQRCCQTNENSHRIAGAALIYALNSWRHSVRAAVRLNLKLSRE